MEKKCPFLILYCFCFFTIIGWQLTEVSAVTEICDKEVDIPAEIDVVNELNQKSQEKTLTNEIDEHWLQCYFANKEDHPKKDDPIDPDTNGEDHAINMIDDGFSPVDGLIWEVYGRNESNKFFCIAKGDNGDRFGPSIVTPPPGADPLPSDIYFIRIIRDPDIGISGDITYFLEVQGTGTPKVYGFIQDAFNVKNFLV